MSFRADFSPANTDIEHGAQFLFLPASIGESMVSGEFTISMFGADNLGNRVTVIFRPIMTFDVKLNNELTIRSDGFDDIARLSGRIREANTRSRAGDVSFEVVELYDYNQFSAVPSRYLRVSTRDMFLRHQILGELREEGRELFGDDSSFAYFRKFARENKISSAGWNAVNGNYSCEKNRIGYIVRLDSPRSIVRARGLPDEFPDMSMLAVWDIETHNFGGGPPKPGEEYDIFMLCLTFFRAGSARPLYSMCAVMHKCDAISNKSGNIAHEVRLVVCKTQREVLTAFFETMDKMRPEFLLSFNGGNFDWPLVIDKAKLLELVPEMFGSFSAEGPRPNSSVEVLLDRHFGSRQLKISAEDNHILRNISKVAGLIDIDGMPVFSKMYTRAEIGKMTSLNYFLESNELPKKNDMEMSRMFRIVRDPQDSAGMSEVAEYCVIDTVRPQELMVKRAVMMDKRELASLSCMPLESAYYYADSGKVLNLVGKYSEKLHVAFNAHAEERDRDKYPGAFVFPPIRGLNRKKPVCGLDFASLYPSTMMDRNLSPDMAVHDPKTAEKLARAGYELHKIGPFMCSTNGVERNVSGWVVRHNGVWQRDKSTTRQIPGEDLKYHPNGPALPGERMGVFPFALRKLFDKRVPVKKRFVELEKEIESCEIEIKNLRATITEKTSASANTSAGEKIAAIKRVIAEKSHLKTCVDTKQKALKLISNTFYGASGYYRSPLYEVLIAGGVTESGQHSIKTVAEFVKARGFEIQYGDTDSLYLCCPDAAFAEIRARRAAGEITHEAYCGRLVEITMVEMDKLNAEVTRYLAGISGTLFLKMAYEEVGFPTMFCGKKKYFMIPHRGKVNFSAKPMLRGIDIVKKGQPGIAKKLGGWVIKQLLDINNTEDPLDLVVKKFKEFLVDSSSIDAADFKQTKTYRADKKNCVSDFVKRIVEENAAREAAGENTRGENTRGENTRLYEPPEDGDKFEFVLVKKPQGFDCGGRMIGKNVSSRMEYYRVFNAANAAGKPLEIDTRHYAEKCIAGIFARFIAYHNQFQPDTPGGNAGEGNRYEVENEFDADERYKRNDKYCIDGAKRFLIGICANHFANNRTANRAKAAEIRRICRGDLRESQEREIRPVIMTDIDKFIDSKIGTPMPVCPEYAEYLRNNGAADLPAIGSLLARQKRIMQELEPRIAKQRADFIAREKNARFDERELAKLRADESAFANALFSAVGCEAFIRQVSRHFTQSAPSRKLTVKSLSRGISIK